MDESATEDPRRLGPERRAEIATAIGASRTVDLDQYVGGPLDLLQLRQVTASLPAGLRGAPSNSLAGLVERLRTYEFPAQDHGHRQSLKLTAEDAARLVEAWLRTDAPSTFLVAAVHPWANEGPGDWCDLCFHPDGDSRCLRCGKSTGGPAPCGCSHGPVIGPCAALAAGDST